MEEEETRVEEEVREEEEKMRGRTRGNIKSVKKFERLNLKSQTLLQLLWSVSWIHFKYKQQFKAVYFIWFQNKCFCFF